MIFDYFKTMFNLVVGIVSQDVLFYITIVAFFLLALWIVLSLVTSRELKMSNATKKLSKFIAENGINSETEPQIIALVSKMPRQFVGQFRLWQNLGAVTPGVWFNQQDCVETPLYGGIYNQNRSLMKSAINALVIALTMLSLALVSAGEEAFTGLALAQALIFPMFGFLLFKVEYYVYTTIRQYQYKVAVESFNELIEIMNEKYEMGEIKFANQPEPLVAGEVQDCPQEEEMKEEVVEEKRGRGRPRKTEEEKNAPLKIENDADFEKALARAEKLMARLHKPLSDSQKRRTNKELADVMDKLAQYKKKRN